MFNANINSVAAVRVFSLGIYRRNMGGYSRSEDGSQYFMQCEWKYLTVYMIRRNSRPFHLSAQMDSKEQPSMKQCYSYGNKGNII